MRLPREGDAFQAHAPAEARGFPVCAGGPFSGRMRMMALSMLALAAHSHLRNGAGELVSVSADGRVAHWTETKKLQARMAFSYNLRFGIS